MASTAFTNQSDAAKTGLNLTLDPVERFITAGLQQKLYEVLGVRAGWLTSDDEQAVLQKLFGRENQGANDTSTQYPYGLLTMQSMAEAEDMGNVHAFSVRGLTAIVHDADARAYRVQLMPTDFDVRFKFVTNDYLQLLSIVTKLMHSRRRGWLKFNVVYGRLTLAISVTPDANLTVPTKESTAGALAEYPLELNLKVKGYTSLPTLIEQQVVTKIEMSTSVQDNPEIGSEAAQVWAWTTAPMSSIASMTVVDNVPGVYVPTGAPVVRTVSNATAPEGQMLVHTVTLNFASSSPLNFSYSLVGGTATAAVDFQTAPVFSNGVTLLGNTLTLPPFVQQFTVSYLTLTDNTVEGSETATLTVDGIAGTGTITNVTPVAATYDYFGFFTTGNQDYTGVQTGEGVFIAGIGANPWWEGGISLGTGAVYLQEGTLWGHAPLNGLEQYPGIGNMTYLGGANQGVTSLPLTPMPVGETHVWIGETIDIWLDELPHPGPWEIQPYLPMLPGDAIFLQTQNFPGIGAPYSVTVVVGPNVTNGEVYRVTGTALDMAQGLTLTRLPNIGVRAPAPGDVTPAPGTPLVASVTDATAAEGTQLAHTVTLTAATLATTTYAFNLLGVTAQTGVDFTSVPTFSDGVTLNAGVITVPSGVLTFTVSYQLTTDALLESTETTLLIVGGYVAVGSILDNGTPADPLFSQVEFLWQPDGPADSTVFVDQSSHARSIITTGTGITMKSANALMGTYSAEFTGAGDLSLNLSTDLLVLGTGDHCVEGRFMRLAGGPQNQYVFNLNGVGSQGMRITWLGIFGNYAFSWVDDAGIRMQGTFNYPVGTEVDWCFDRSGDTLRFFLQGVQVGSATLLPGQGNLGTATAVVLGNTSAGNATYPFYGTQDCVRITKASRYQADYTLAASNFETH